MMSRMFPAPSVLAVLAFVSAPVGAQKFDLTGTWKSNTMAEVYRFRQIDNHFYWMVDGIPTRGYSNLFIGLISGTTITGYWVDLPGSPTMNTVTSTLVLKIESNDRVVKVSESARLYNGSVWTRIADPGPTTTTATTNSSGSPTPAGTPPTGSTTTAPGSSTSTSSTGAVYGGVRKWDYRDVGTEYGDSIGRIIRFTCERDSLPVEWRATYGRGVYTGDSGLCQSAVHAGVITRQGGDVTVEIMPGQNSYEGPSTQNGVLGQSYGKWGVSFRFVTSSAQHDVSSPPPVRNSGTVYTGSFGWESPIPPDLRKIGTRVQFNCPPGGRFLGYVWGTGVYTGDSYPCSAAVHSGVINFERGGTITVEIRPGQNSYQGSARNGVNSGNFSEYSVSFAVVK